MDRVLCDVIRRSLAFRPFSHMCLQLFTVKASSHRLLMALKLTGTRQTSRPVLSQMKSKSAAVWTADGVVTVSAHTPWNYIHFHTQGWAAYLFRQECGFGRCANELLADTQQRQSEAVSIVNPLLSRNDAAVCRRTPRDQSPSISQSSHKEKCVILR